MADCKVEVDSITVAYTDRGKGVPILLMHGNPDTRHSWEPMLQELGEGYRIIAPDFPGFGDSDPLSDNVAFGPALMADFWNDFIDEIGINEPVHVVVHDFGGPWLLPWVADHAARVRSLFVLNTLFHRDYHYHLWARAWQQPLLGELTIFLLRRPMLRWVIRRQSTKFPDHLINQTYDHIHPTMRRTVLRTYRAYFPPDVVLDPWEQNLLAVIESKPVCVLWGDMDPYIPSRFAERFGVEATHLPDCGHWLHLEEPGRVAAELGTFLEAGKGS